MKGVFGDSFYFIALLNARDFHHDQARKITRELGGIILTTRWVVAEVGKHDPRESFSAVIKRTVDAPPASNFSQLPNQMQEFAGKGVFTAEERAEMRRRQRQPLKLLRY